MTRLSDAAKRIARAGSRLACPFVALALAMSGALAQAQTTQPAAPATVEVPRFEIRRYLFEGASLIPQAELERRTHAYTGKQRSFADVQRALEAVERAYGEAGYNAVQVVLPEQELERGEVRFEVAEARVARVVVEGNKYFDEANIRASVPSLAPGSAPNIGRVARDLRVANENPSKKATVLLRSGQSEGTVDAVVRVIDEDWQKWSVTIDNSGASETGRLRIGLGMQNANFGYNDHVLTLQYVGAPYQDSPDDTSPSQLSPVPSRRVLILGAGYHVPLYALGDSLDFVAGYSNVNSGVVQGLFNVAGAGTIFGGRYTRNLDPIDEYEHRAAFGFDYRAYDNSGVRLVGSSTQLIPDVTVHPWSLGYGGQLRGAQSETFFSTDYLQNLPGGSDGTQATFCAVRTSASGQCAPARYKVARAGFNHSQALPSDWQARFAMNGQWTRDQLVPGEQFGLGGMDSVRGFFTRELAGDVGYRGSVELYTPDLGVRSGIDGLRARALAFVDWGLVRRNQPSPGEIAREGVSSTGVGLRVAYERQLIFAADVGYVLNPGGLQGRGESLTHFRVSYVF